MSKTGRSVARGPTSAATLEALLTPLLSDAFRLANSLARDKADAEDLVQESALLALRHFGTFKQWTNFKAWFYRILTNCFLSKVRTEKRRPRNEDLDDLPDLYLHRRTEEIGLHAENKDPATTLIKKLDVEQIMEALHALSDEYRAVCSLYFVEDMSYQGIADILDCPVGTVRSRLHRGRKMLQKMLWSVAQDAGIVAELSVRTGAQ